MNRQVIQFFLTSSSLSEPSTTSASFLQDFSHNFVGTVNAFQCPQLQSLPDIAFPIDVLENK